MPKQRFIKVEKPESGDAIVATELDFTPKIKQISSGIGFLIILTDFGDVYVEGVVGNYKFANKFEKIDNIPKIKQMTCGEFYFLLIDEYGRVFICGEFGDAQHSNITENSDIINQKIKFTSSGADISFIVTITNDIYVGGCWEAYNGQKDSTEVFNKVTTNDYSFDVKDLQSGYYHSVLLDNFGNVYGSGKVDRNQVEGYDSVLKIFTKLNVPFKVKEIATYTMGTLLLSYNNELYGCGENSDRQLGIEEKSVKNFTKIVIEDVTIQHLFRSGHTSNIILTNKGFYVTGMHDAFGREVKLTPLKQIDNYNEWKYNCALMAYEDLYIVQSDEEVNGKDFGKMIYPKLYLQICNNNNPFLDINIYEN
ncbi:hypothetical protein ABK040_015327 [Willaertia magna]